MSTITGLLSAWWNVITGFLCRWGGLGFQLARKVRSVARLADTSITISHNLKASNSFIIKPVSMISPQLVSCCATLPSVYMPMAQNQQSDHPKCPAFHKMLTSTLPSIQQHPRLGITKVTYIGFVSNTTYLSIHTCMSDDLSVFANILPHALFHFVTARANALAVPETAGLPIRSNISISRQNIHLHPICNTTQSNDFFVICHVRLFDNCFGCVFMMNCPEVALCCQCLVCRQVTLNC